MKRQIFIISLFRNRKVQSEKNIPRPNHTEIGIFLAFAFPPLPTTTAHERKSQGRMFTDRTNEASAKQDPNPNILAHISKRQPNKAKRCVRHQN